MTKRTSASGNWLSDNWFSRWGDIAAPVIIFLVVATGTVCFLLYHPSSGPFDKAPLAAPGQPKSCDKSVVKTPVKVYSPGAAATMNIYIGRDGYREEGESGPLAIQKGKLCPGSILTMHTTQFARSDGHTLPANQVASWAQVDNNGTDVTVWVLVAPHHQRVSADGAFSGTVTLDSPIAQGASIPVIAHVTYQNLDLVLAFGFLAAFGGFTWAWLLHNTAGGITKQGYFFRHVMVCLAVLLAASVPVVNVQVLANQDWQGSLSQFISLATIIGAAAIAATPTFRALAVPKSLPDRSRSKQTEPQSASTASASTASAPA
jgi:hypothetical protein